MKKKVKWKPSLGHFQTLTLVFCTDRIATPCQQRIDLSIRGIGFWSNSAGVNSLSPYSDYCCATSCLKQWCYATIICTKWKCRCCVWSQIRPSGSKHSIWWAQLWCYLWDQVEAVKAWSSESVVKLSNRNKHNKWHTHTK